MMKNVRMSRTNHSTKRMRPAADNITPDEVMEKPKAATYDYDLAPNKNTPFANYARKTKPPLGRALPVRGEHNSNTRANTQS